MELEHYDKNLLNDVGIEWGEVDKTEDIPGRSTKPEKSGWNTQTCIDISYKYKLPSAIKEATKQQEIANRFVRFYASGNVPPTHTEHDVILAMASLIFKDKATTSVDLVWGEKDYSDDEKECAFSVIGDTLPSTGFLPDHENENSTSPAKAEDVFGLTGEVTDLDSDGMIKYESKEEREKREKLNQKSIRPEEHLDQLSKMTAPFLLEYAKGSLAKFVQACADVFARYGVTLGVNRIFIAVLRTLNFLALTMLRSTVKNTAQMTTAFLKEQYKHNVNALVPSLISAEYAPPTKRCVEKLAFITKADPSIRSFVAKLVRLWINDSDTHAQMAAMIGASVLTHTAWHGMGILHLLFEVCAHYSISWKLVMKESLITTTMTTWKEIYLFCKVYQQKGSPDPTVAWARIVDDSYFMGLAIGRHIPLASLFIVPIVNIQGDEGIYISKWAADHAHEVEYYHAASEWLHTKLSGTDHSVKAATQEASHLASLINRPKTMQPLTPAQIPTPSNKLNPADFDD